MWTQSVRCYALQIESPFTRVLEAFMFGDKTHLKTEELKLGFLKRSRTKYLILVIPVSYDDILSQHFYNKASDIRELITRVVIKQVILFNPINLFIFYSFVYLFV